MVKLLYLGRQLKTKLHFSVTKMEKVQKRALRLAKVVVFLETPSRLSLIHHKVHRVIYSVRSHPKVDYLVNNLRLLEDYSQASLLREASLGSHLLIANQEVSFHHSHVPILKEVSSESLLLRANQEVFFHLNLPRILRVGSLEIPKTLQTKMVGFLGVRLRIRSQKVKACLVH